MLKLCLESLQNSEYIDFETILVVNGKVNEDDALYKMLMPSVQILRYEEQIGFAAACNRGVDRAIGKYIFLLNNDAYIKADTIGCLVNTMEIQPFCAAVVPKILSARRIGFFDYSSAAGGELDIFGIPFARGRVFDNIEPDEGQYETNQLVFWGAGAALLIRRELYQSAGGLAEFFFAHMEEIDLMWRFHLMGYCVSANCKAVAYHFGASTIKEASFTKLYLNHRNSIIMLLRNYSYANIIKFVPIRVILDIGFALLSLARGDIIRTKAVVKAITWVLFSLPFVLKGRKAVQNLRKVNDVVILSKLYNRSAAVDYFLLQRRTWNKLRGVD